MFNVRIREISHALSLFHKRIHHRHISYTILHASARQNSLHWCMWFADTVISFHQAISYCDSLCKLGVCVCVLLFFLSHIDNMSLYAFRYHTTPYHTIPYIHKARATLLEWLCFVLECVARFLCLSYFFCKDFIALGVVFST